VGTLSGSLFRGGRSTGFAVDFDEFPEVSCYFQSHSVVFAATLIELENMVIARVIQSAASLACELSRHVVGLSSAALVECGTTIGFADGFRSR